MAFISSGIIEIKLFAVVAEPPASGHNTVSVWHYAQQVTNPNQPDPVAVLTQFGGTITLALSQLLHHDWAVTQTTARWMDLPTNPEAINAAPISGAKTGDRLPTFNSVVYQLKTPFRGKEYKGRKAFAAIAEADTTEDELVDPALTNWKNFINNILLPLTVSGQTLIPVVLSRKNSPLVGGVQTLQAAPITVALLNKTIGTMRKRKMKTVIA